MVVCAFFSLFLHTTRSPTGCKKLDIVVFVNVLNILLQWLCCFFGWANMHVKQNTALFDFSMIRYNAAI